MKIFKKILLVIGILIIIVIILNIIFFFGMGQKKAKAYEVNSPDLNKKVLIATQGSGFKSKVVSNIVEELKDKSVYIKVIDVGNLPETNTEEWNSIVILTSIQMGQMGNGVDEYLSGKNNYDKILLINLGSVNNYSLEYDNLDSISSASKNENIDTLTEKILTHIKALL